jgi:predicted nucleic acid-binding Zn ribbon protein
MALVDYKDTITEEVFEVFVRTKDIPEEVENPETGNISIRIFSLDSVGFQFKGSGFYETEYKHPEKK